MTNSVLSGLSGLRLCDLECVAERRVLLLLGEENDYSDGLWRGWLWCLGKID